MIRIESLWQVYVQSKTLNKKSLQTETYRYKKHLQPYWKNFNLKKLKYKDVHSFMATLYNKGLTHKTVTHCLNLLKVILNRAIEFEEYKKNLPKFPKIIVSNKRERFLSKQEAEYLLLLLKKRSQLWHDICFVALHTGMRAGEIFKVKKEDIDFASGIIHLYDTKNKYSRNIELGNESFRIIKEYTEMNMIFVFFENPPRDVSNHFRSAVKEAGFNEGVADRRNMLVFHSLRHTFASWLAQDGVSIFEISKALGHRDIGMTMRYAHLAPNHTKPAINKLEKDMLYIEEKRRNENKQIDLKDDEVIRKIKRNKGNSSRKKLEKDKVRKIVLDFKE